MSDEEKVVQEEQVSEETTSKEETTEEIKEQPFSEEQEARMQQLIAQATSTAKEEGKREMQGIKDREVAEANRRTKFAQNETASYRTSFDGLDEDTQKEAELARYREQDKYNQSTAQEEAQRQQDATFWGRVNEQALTNLDGLGIDRADKRLDWGEGSRDLPEARGRLDTSIAKILSENKKVAESDMEKRLTAKIEENNLKNRKELNLDSVDTTASSGSGGDSDADFKRDWGSGALPNTKVNMERARKLAS